PRPRRYARCRRRHGNLLFWRIAAVAGELSASNYIPAPRTGQGGRRSGLAEDRGIFARLTQRIPIVLQLRPTPDGQKRFQLAGDFRMSLRRINSFAWIAAQVME